MNAAAAWITFCEISHVSMQDVGAKNPAARVPPGQEVTALSRPGGHVAF